jgi:ankyrin repeat protein
VRLIQLATLSMILLAIGGCSRSPAQPASAKVVSVEHQLVNAIDDHDLPKVRQLFDRGAGVNTRSANNNGETLLMLAAENSDRDIVSLLIEKGADVNAQDTGEDTALIIAARSGNDAIVELLLPKISNADDKKRALFAATEGGGVIVSIVQDPKANSSESRIPATSPVADSPWVRTVKLLLDSGVDLETNDPDFGTPLISAAAYAQTDIFNALLERGANIHARDKRGNTALIAAACECALATMNSDYEIVQILLQRGANPNARNHEGTTALMNAAAGFGHAAIVKLLLDAGANPSARNTKGRTALALALEEHRPDKVNLLRQALYKRR